MSNSFIPRAYQAQPAPQEPAAPEAEVRERKDKVGTSLIRISQYVVVAMAFLIPVVFMPGAPVAIGFSKAIVALVLGLLVVVLLGLASLRFKSVTTAAPLALFLFFGLVAAAYISGFLSGDTADALRGSSFGPQTAGFMAVMALVMTVPLVLQRSKVMVLYTLTAFISGIGLVFLYNILRFFAGPILPFGLFGQVTNSPLGGLNDLAVVAAVAIIVSLITLLQLPLKLWMRVGMIALILASLLVLIVANFFSLWLIIGFFSLLFLIYVLSRDTLFGGDSDESSEGTPLLVIVSLVICMVCGLFVVAGDFAGARVSQITGINYIEVRPSMGATLDMMKAEYQDDILLGSGPNRFGDVWRVNKDRGINETQFWNVDFNSGYGLVPTWFVTLGLLGGVLLIAFHLTLLYTGYRTLIKSESQDSFWFYVATTSFTSAIVLWGIMYIYVPGTTVLLVTALFTGLAFVSYQALVPAASYRVPLASNRRRGLFLMALAVIIVIAGITAAFSVTKQFSAQSTFANAIQQAESIEDFELAVQEAYALYPDETFLTSLAQIRIGQLQNLLAQPEPSEEDQAQFAQLAQQAIVLAERAAAQDNTSVQPYQLLTEVYNILDRAGLEGARERTYASIDNAQQRDPLSPLYDYNRAFLAATNSDFDAARNHIADSLAKKSNFTNALFLLSQIAIEQGNVEEAIVATQQVVTFEPNNPTRYYQLGILLAANDQLDEAVTTYRTALQLDPNYANARYMLGLAYVAQGNIDQALNEFRTVQAANPDNQALQAVITELQNTGGLQNLNLGLETPVEEAAAATSTEDGVVASGTPETDLITTVNTEPAAQNQSEESSSDNPASNQ